MYVLPLASEQAQSRAGVRGKADPDPSTQRSVLSVGAPPLENVQQSASARDAE